MRYEAHRHSDRLAWTRAGVIVEPKRRTSQPCYGLRVRGLVLYALAALVAAAGCRGGAPACKQLCKPTQPTELVRVAGQPGGSGHVDGPVALAHFRDPWQLACDGAGHAYLTEDGAHVIRAIDLKSGVVSTLAGRPNAVGSADGIGDAATFHGPSGIALGGGRLYVADVEHHLLRVIDLATRRVSTLGGKVNTMGYKDGPLDGALFNEPEGLALDGDSLYVGDTDNNMIRKIDLRTRTVSSVAGEATMRGTSDGVGRAARFYKPMSIAADGHGRLYVCDTLNNALRAVRLSDGAVTTLARFPATPLGVGVVGGDVLVGLGDHRVVRVDPKSGAVSEWLGAAGQEGFVDAASGAEARFSRPASVCLDGAGNLLVADAGNHALRAVTLASGAVRTLAGARSRGASDGTPDEARFAGPLGLAWDPAGAWYVSDSGNDTIRKVAADGRVSTIAGAAGQAGAVDGSGAHARFSHPQGLALDGRGGLYVADTDNRLLRRVDLASGAVTTLSPAIEGGLRPAAPTGLAFSDGALYVSDQAAQVVYRLDPGSQRGAVVAGKPAAAGAIDGAATAARFNGPQSIAADGRGNLYIADVGNNAIRKIALSSRTVSTVAGPRVTAGFGKEPPFNYPTHVAANGLGDVFVSDSANNVVRRIDAAGRVTTLVGNWTDSGVRLGPLPAQLDHPAALALDDAGRLALIAENTLLVAR